MALLCTVEPKQVLFLRVPRLFDSSYYRLTYPKVRLAAPFDVTCCARTIRTRNGEHQGSARLTLGQSLQDDRNILAGLSLSAASISYRRAAQCSDPVRITAACRVNERKRIVGIARDILVFRRFACNTSKQKEQGI